MHLRGLLLALALAIACGPEDEPPGACGCVGGGECGDDLCDMVVRTGDTIADEAALDCALTALRDRTPGRLRWSDRTGDAAIPDSDRLWLLADGTALHHPSRPSGSGDICTLEGPTTLGPLQDPTFFASCLAEPAAQARFDCLSAALLAADTECAARTEACDL